MIRYSLKCDHDHAFDGWYASADAFDKLRSGGMVACVVCGSDKVDKTLMAPAVRVTADKPLRTPQSDAEAAVAELRRAVEKNSDYVGADFVTEARAMHDGDTPERAIWGEAKPDEARALLDDGIPVVPLPFMGRRKTN